MQRSIKGIIKPEINHFGIIVGTSQHWADIIIPQGADNLVAIDMVVTKIKSLIAAKATTADKL